MKKTELNLNEPFEVTLVVALELPNDSEARVADEAIAKALLSLYSAAHGRTVQTSIGAIAIVSATDPSLRGAPLLVSNRSELVDLGERRMDFKTNRSIKSIDLRAGSALGDFISGRLGAPEWWPTPPVSNRRTTLRIQPLSANINHNN